MEVLERLRHRIYEISKKYKHCHIGSNVSSLPIIHEIYTRKKPDDIFVLSSGHAALAWYVVLEEFEGTNHDGIILPLDAEDMFKEMGVHPARCEKYRDWVTVSAGSLGQGITVACGLAAAKPDIRVWCLISDGELAEGCVLEALRYSQKHLPNLEIFVNCNGISATMNLDEEEIRRILTPFKHVNIRKTYAILPWCQGLETHYYVLSEEDKI